jgi:hypothetical protein
MDKVEFSYIYKNYLVSEDHYKEAEIFWENFFSQITKETGDESAWMTFLGASTRLANGEIWDPVYQAAEFGALVPILRKLRLNPNKMILLTVMDCRHLTTPSEDDQRGLIDASVVAGDWDTSCAGGNLSELRVWTLPTTNLLSKLKQCLREWMRDDVDINRMNEYIRVNKLQGEPDFRAPDPRSHPRSERH